MAKKKSKFIKIEEFFERLALGLSKFAGSTLVFLLAFFCIVLWVVSGPVFNYSEGWQLVINTGTTIITFLMVFLIQRAQNKDALAIQLKLNEIVAAIIGANNKLIDVETLTEKDLEKLKDKYSRISDIFSGTNNKLDTHKMKNTETEGKLPSKINGRK